MSYTGKLGASNSSFGNIVFGVSSLADIGIGERLLFTETVNVNLKGVQLSESIEFIEDLSYRIPQIRVHINESLTFTENATRNVSPLRSNVEAIGFDESLQRSVKHVRSLSESITFSENLVKTRFIRNLSETLTFSETLLAKRVKRTVLSETLIFAETATRNSTFHRSISETINFVGGYTKKYGNGSLEISYPEVRILKKQNIFVLKGFNAVITLPNPEFDDSEANTDTLTVYRSMSNQIYTYVKRQELRKLAYSFRMSRKKSLELRRFFDSERTNKIEIMNHKSEIWIGYLTTNPINYTAVRLAQPCGEEVDVSLDFEAVRVI